MRRLSSAVHAWCARLLSGCALLCALAGASPALAAPFTGLHVFGDSLSDTGNVFVFTETLSPGNGIPPPPYFGGRFTNGPNYVDWLGLGLGFSSAPVLLGGNNYAVGGATAASGLPPGLIAQRDLFLLRHAGVADPSALYVTWIGANDMQAVIDAYIADPTTASGAAAAIGSSIADLRQTILALNQAGARSFLVPNLPNLAFVPKYTKLNDPAVSLFALQLSDAFNLALAQMLATIPGNQLAVHAFDANALFLAALLDPAGFGLTNVTTPCFSGSPFAPGTVCADAARFLFWDEIHPTAAAHAHLAYAMYRTVIPLPAGIWLLLSGLLALLACVRRRPAR
jgi:outer membrane lipase/esterase